MHPHHAQSNIARCVRMVGCMGFASTWSPPSHHVGVAGEAMPDMVVDIREGILILHLVPSRHDDIQAQNTKLHADIRGSPYGRWPTPAAVWIYGARNTQLPGNIRGSCPYGGWPTPATRGSTWKNFINVYGEVARMVVGPPRPPCGYTGSKCTTAI